MASEITITLSGRNFPMKNQKRLPLYFQQPADLEMSGTLGRCHVEYTVKATSGSRCFSEAASPHFVPKLV